MAREEEPKPTLRFEENGIFKSLVPMEQGRTAIFVDLGAKKPHKTRTVDSLRDLVREQERIEETQRYINFLRGFTE